MPIKYDEWFVPLRSSNSTTCVESRFTPDSVYVRNSIQPNAGTAVFSHDEWAVFVAGVKDGDYDI
jgi:Domain of unknown function (DUF397)